MPFVSSAQRRACMYKTIDDVRSGRAIRWDCVKFGKLRYAGRLRTVWLTNRGAKYVVVHGKKVYVYGVY